MKHLITRILNALNKPQDVEETTWAMLPPEDSIYPLVLKHGYVTVEREDTIEYHDATPIINADRSLTITRGGDIIGWHDTDTYWRVTTQ